MLNYEQLSANGSDRATAYNMSNKIVRRDGQLFAAWLDAPLGPAQPSRVQLGVCDARGLLQTSFQLGSGIDNHCGPALALDASGRMHAIIGAHAGDFHQLVLYKNGEEKATTTCDSGSNYRFPAMAPGRAPRCGFATS